MPETHNPSMFQHVEFEPFILKKEPLFWPFLEINVIDQEADKFLSFSGCEPCFTTISLVDYAEEILGKKEFIYAQAQITRNQDNLQLM